VSRRQVESPDRPVAYHENSIDAELAHLLVQEPAVNAKEFSGSALVALRLAQGTLDKGLFQRRNVGLPTDLKRHLVSPARADSFGRQAQLYFVLGHDSFTGQHQRPLNRIFELAHVTWPMVFIQHPERLRGDGSLSSAPSQGNTEQAQEYPDAVHEGAAVES